MRNNWVEIRENLKKRLSAGHYKVWIEPLDASFEEGTLVLHAQNSFAAESLRARFLPVVEECAAEVAGVSVRIEAGGCAVSAFGVSSPAKEGRVRGPASLGEYVTESHSAGPVFEAYPTAESAVRETPRPRPFPTAVQHSLPLEASTVVRPVGRDWRHSFEDFVVGPCNELAFAASKSISASAAGVDMLFLSSAPGLGKTHLMQAVGKSLFELCNRRNPKVEYLTAEEFSSRFYLSIKGQDTDRFKARYRDVDLLLLEDVHFLQGKEKMQAELLATIKALQDRGSKVVCTSSFMPRDLRQMDDHLLSRLNAGLAAVIDRPDRETRKRLFRSKASLHQVLLPEDVESVLADHIQADVRRIESCLQNLILKARLFNSNRITMQMAWDVISSLAGESPVLDLEGIINQVCRGFSISREQLFSIRRKAEFVTARNAAFYLARKHTDLSLEAIGRTFNRKHSTVLKGITNCEREISRETPAGRQMAHAISLIERNGNIAVR